MVAAAYDKQAKKKVALKKIKMNKKHNGIPASALRQIAILKSITHPNIVRQMVIDVGLKMFFMIFSCLSFAFCWNTIQVTFMK